MAATTAKIVAGVAGGYLLGRTKKLRLAITIAGLLAGKKLAADPKSIVDKMVDQNPELQHLKGQLTEGLTSAAKELAVATAASRMEAVTDTLQQGLGDQAQKGRDQVKKGLGGQSDEADEGAEGDEESATDESADESGDEPEEEPRDEEGSDTEDESPDDEGSADEDEEPRRQSKKSASSSTRKASAKKSGTRSRSRSRTSKATAGAR